MFTVTTYTKINIGSSIEIEISKLNLSCGTVGLAKVYNTSATFSHDHRSLIIANEHHHNSLYFALQKAGFNDELSPDDDLSRMFWDQYDQFNRQVSGDLLIPVHWFYGTIRGVRTQGIKRFLNLTTLKINDSQGREFDEIGTFKFKQDDYSPVFELGDDGSLLSESKESLLNYLFYNELLDE